MKRTEIKYPGIVYTSFGIFLCMILFFILCGNIRWSVISLFGVVIWILFIEIVWPHDYKLVVKKSFGEGYKGGYRKGYGKGYKEGYEEGYIEYKPKLEGIDGIEEEVVEFCCDRCGAIASESDATCPGCGDTFDEEEEVEEEIEVVQFECPECGSFVNETDDACPGCGVEFEEEAEEGIEEDVEDLEEFEDDEGIEEEVDDEKECVEEEDSHEDISVTERKRVAFEFMCECGAIVNESDATCPGCGDIFDEEEVEEEVYEFPDDLFSFDFPLNAEDNSVDARAQNWGKNWAYEQPPPPGGRDNSDDILDDDDFDSLLEGLEDEL